MIKIYPSITECDPIEEHEFEGVLSDFMDQQSPGWRDSQARPLPVFVNGILLPKDGWDRHIKAKDDVKIIILPKNGIISFIRKIDPLLNWLMKGADVKEQQDSPTSQEMKTANAEGNQPKLNQVVPELAGRHIRYPDYVKPPIRYFSEPRTQMLEMLLCVGPGQYQINAEDIKIGETPVTNLGSEVEYRIFQPNESMLGHPAMDIWYVAPEVGGTSNGSAGLEISTEYTGTADGGLVADEFAFNGNQITITAPVYGHWPSGMRVGSRITKIDLPLSYAVTLTGVGVNQRNRITGNFKEILPISVDDPVGISLPFPNGVTLAAISVDANGDGWIELRSGADYVKIIPTGTQTLTFRTGRQHYYEVLSISGQAITLRKLVSNGAIFVPVSSWLGFATVSSTDAEIDVDASTFAGDWTGPFSATPKQEACTLTHLDFFFRGLGVVNSDNEIEEKTVTLNIDYRDRLTGGAWTTVTRSFTNNTVDDVGYTVGITHPLMVPEFRVRREGIGDADSNTYDTCVWYGMRSLMLSRTSYPWTMLFLKLKSGGVVAANSESKINVIATRILPRLRGDNTFNTPEPNSDISAMIYYIANSIGYTESDIDMVELHRLHDIWLARNEHFNHVFDETTVKEALATVLRAGFSELTIEKGKIKPVRDDVRTVFEQAYSPQNMVGSLKKAWRSKRNDDNDGVEVEYMDGNTWTRATVVCTLPGSSGEKLENLKLEGILSRDIAWRIGMRQARKQRYERWSYDFSTEMDALNSQYLSYVAICGDMQGYAQSCIMQNIVANGDGRARITVSEPLQWGTGTHIVGYRDVNGTFIGPFEAVRGASEYEIIAAIPLPYPVVTLKREPPHVYFGFSEKYVMPALVTAVTPSSDMEAKVTAKNYDVRIYADDNNSAPV